jgi:hypothetical protein
METNNLNSMKKVFKEAEIKDLISKVSGNEITFSRLVEILNEKVEDISNPSEDIKQAIEEFANSQYNKDATLICANSLRESIESYEDGKRDGIIIGAEFALNLSENSGQVDEDLVQKIKDKLYELQHPDGYIPEYVFGDIAAEIAALIASSPSGENGDKMLEAAKQILDLHVCEMEGLSSGQPTPTEWMNAVDKLSEAISNYENKANENSNVCM